jgi:hypothetical protein
MGFWGFGEQDVTERSRLQKPLAQIYLLQLKSKLIL